MTVNCKYIGAWTTFEVYFVCCGWAVPAGTKCPECGCPMPLAGVSNGVSSDKPTDPDGAETPEK